MPRYYKNQQPLPQFFPDRPNRTTILHYGVIGDKEDQPTGRYPFGQVRMEHTRAQELPNFSGGKELWRESQVTELFDHIPETMEVSGMYAHKALRPHMMTVMALAMQDHPNATIVADSVLSGFSSRLAQNAHKRGLLQPHEYNLDMVSETGMDEDHDDNQLASREEFTDHVMSGKGYPATEIPHSEVMAGKQFLKQMLRPTPEPTPAPTPVVDHPQFPGM